MQLKRNDIHVVTNPLIKFNTLLKLITKARLSNNCFKFKLNHHKIQVPVCLVAEVFVNNQLLVFVIKFKLEDLKVLRRSPDLFDNVKIGQGQIQLIIKHILLNPYMGVAAILVTCGSPNEWHWIKGHRSA